ncbi:hypothetical protein [Undibacterium sp. TC9W]|uniref:hypothetical protein n=1 Tax=Undibacterium sp. TC9W TaxID=3413053 RepID=UPI003BEF4D40
MHWVDKQEDFDRAAAEGKCVGFETNGTPMLGFPDGVEQEPILRIEVQDLSAKQLYFLKRELYQHFTYTEIRHLHTTKHSEIAMGLHGLRVLAQRLNELGIRNHIVHDL